MMAPNEAAIRAERLRLDALWVREFPVPGEMATYCFTASTRVVVAMSRLLQEVARYQAEATTSMAFFPHEQVNPAITRIANGAPTMLGLALDTDDTVASGESELAAHQTMTWEQFRTPFVTQSGPTPLVEVVASYSTYVARSLDVAQGQARTVQSLVERQGQILRTLTSRSDALSGDDRLYLHHAVEAHDLCEQRIRGSLQSVRSELQVLAEAHEDAHLWRMSFEQRHSPSSLLQRDPPTRNERSAPELGPG